MKQLLTLKDVSKSFDQSNILNAIDLELDKTSVLSILGKSGSGKTTLLKIIAGLEEADSGEIILEGKHISELKPQQRNIIYLYQEALLFPHLSVFENIAFGLHLKKFDKSKIKTKVMDMLKALGLEGMENKNPDQLSGGEKQRVAFGRAMVIEPKLLLLDEPFGALDVETRAQMQNLFKKLANRFSVSALFVTHDLKEAIIMGDRLGKIENGNYTAYKSKADFYADEKSGVQDEINFWRTIE